MSFAIADIEVIQKLKGFRLSLFLAVRHEEFLGGGVCKLGPLELAQKYEQLSNESNVGRHRKEMIAEGWFIKVGGGIATKKFESDNETAKNAVGLNDVQTNDDDLSELQKMQDPANFAVFLLCLLQKLQFETAKIAGTTIVIKDLDYLRVNSKNTHEGAHGRASPAQLLFSYFPQENFTPSDAGFIEAEVNLGNPIDKAAWLSTIDTYRKNYKPELKQYLPTKIANVLSVYKAERKKVEKNGAKKDAGKPTVGNGNGLGNGNGNYRADREQSAINDHLAEEQIRRAVGERRRQRNAEGIPGSNVLSRK